jgi:carbon monoxide dehydrogenase subunit G
MDKLLNEFTVNRPIDETWAVLTDVERIAPCMPGAELKEIEGDIFRGVVKVKLGAIATAFKGQAKFLELDEAGHRVVLQGEGRDTTGKGNADALVTATLHPVGADQTKVGIETELKITGKVAQFGRGIMGDVSKKLIAQFATNLNTMLDSGQTSASPASTGTAPDSSPGTSSSGTSTSGTSTSGPAKTGTATTGTGETGPGAAASPSGDDTPLDAPAGVGAASVAAGTGSVAAAAASRSAAYLRCASATSAAGTAASACRTPPVDSRRLTATT